MPPRLGYFILSANGNDIGLAQCVDGEISRSNWIEIPGQVHGSTTYWLVLSGRYQIRRSGGQASNLVIRAVQTATLG